MYFLKRCLVSFSIILGCVGQLLAAHQGSIKGDVRSANDHLPLTGATVVILETSQGAVTDIFGKYTFNQLAAGPYTLKISYVGYESQRVEVTIKDNESVQLNTQLKASSLMLSEITVSPQKAMGAKQLNTLSSVDILLRPTQSSQDVLRIVPGLFIAQHAGGGKAEQIFLRGFDIDHGTDINLSVDGLPVNMVSHAHGQGYSDLHFVIPETVEQVHFEKGLYNADKGNFATAGFVEFKTKDVIQNSSVLLEAGQFDTYRLVSMVDLLGEKEEKNIYRVLTLPLNIWDRQVILKVLKTLPA